MKQHFGLKSQHTNAAGKFVSVFCELQRPHAECSSDGCSTAMIRSATLLDHAAHILAHWSSSFGIGIVLLSARFTCSFQITHHSYMVTVSLCTHLLACACAVVNCAAYSTQEVDDLTLLNNEDDRLLESVIVPHRWF